MRLGLSQRTMLYAALFAARDLLRDARMSFCLILGVMSIVSPLLVLFGLRYGIVESLRDTLRHNPATLELRPLTQGQFDGVFFVKLRSRPEAGYVEPTPRFLSTILSVRSEKMAADDELMQLDMLPSREGDPLWGGVAEGAPQLGQLIISTPAAERLRVATGDKVQVVLSRFIEGRHERMSMSMTIAAVLPLGRLKREAALATPAYVDAYEDFIEGRGSGNPLSDASSAQEQPRLYSGFRLFARDVDGVEPLRDWLVQQGLQVETAASEIALIRNLDKGLGLLFAALALIGGGGALLNMSVNLWANVERRRHELGVLRLVGFSSAALAIFPLIQAMIIGVSGVLLACALAFGSGPVIGHIMAKTAVAGLVIFHLPLWAVAGSCGLACLCAALSSVIAGRLSARIDPSSSLRKV